MPSSVHWYGIRIDNAMDGVSGLTRDPVPPGGTFDDAFDLPDAGTYRYHAHTSSMEQVAHGLAWPLIVDEPEAPDIDRDEVRVLDDWLIDPDTMQIADGSDSPIELRHGGRTGNLTGTLGPLRDAILSLPGRPTDIVFAADNPGDWLLHCHMLAHAASGMMTWLRVT